MDLKYSFYVNQTTRQRIIDLLEPYTVEQLNQIPTGFNNNLIWNAGHVVVTQQLLVYRMSNLETKVDDQLIEQFRKGSAPNQVFDATAIDELKFLLAETPKMLKTDYEYGMFTQYNAYTTSYGIELTRTEEAIIFNNTHEAMHLGTMLAMRKLL
ncbi:MAG: DinB family protein [Bacteroidetes bacterium]|nr:DinB family protein [Bacteroidota bacterium]